MKLTSKFMVLFVLLAIVPLALVSYLSYESHRQTIEQATINRLVSTTTFKEAAVNRWFEDAKRSIRVLAGRPLIRKYAAVLVSRGPADPEYKAAHGSIREDILNSTAEGEKSLMEVFILRGSDGLILASSDEKQEGRYRENEPYFVEGKKRTCVQTVYYSMRLGQAVMTIGTPIKDKDGNLIAVLAGHVNLAEMSEIMMQRCGLSATEKTCLVNKFNFFVTDPGLEPGPALKKAVYTDGVKAGLEHQNGVGFYNDYRGVPVIGVYRWMPERELVILAEVDQAEAFAPIFALRKAQLGIGAAVAAIVALLGLFFARTITRPVLQLVKGAEKVGRGNLEYRIEMSAKDEVGQLATAFNKMGANLHRSQETLRESEAKYRNLTESLEELIYRADPETFVATYVNHAVAEIYGYTVEEFLGDPTLWENSIHPEDKEGVFAAFTEAQRKMESVAIEYRIIRKDKIVRWVTDHAIWEKDQQGNVVSLNGVVYDITERKRAEEQTKQLQEYLQLQFERIPIAYITWDIEFRVRSWNPAAERIFGFTAQEALGKHPYDLIVPKEAQPHVDDLWRRLLEGDTTAHSINDNITKDGRTIICQWSNTPLSKADGTVEGILSMVQDITERKQAEEKILRQGKLLGGINKVFREALTCETDEEVANSFLSVAEELTGSKFGLIGELNQAGRFDTIAITNPGWDACKMPDSEVTVLIKDMEIRGIDRSTIREEKSRIVNDLSSNPDRIGFPDGHPPVTSFLGVPLKQAGRTMGMIGLGNKESGYDRYDQEAIEAISVAFVESLMRKRAEKHLKESEEKFREMSASAQEGIITMDSEGNISFWNKAAEKIFGYSAQEAIGKELHTLLVPQRYHNNYREGFSRFRTTGLGPVIGKTLELEALKKDGTEFPIELSVSAIKIKGTWHSTGILRDISERKRLEAQLRQAQKMEAIGTLASGIAHDFNNILTTIIGIASLCLADLKEDGPLRQDLEEINQAGEKAAALTRQLLAFSRKQIVQPKILDLNELLTDIEKMLSRLIREDIELLMIPGPELWQVEVDPGQMEQVIINLAINAKDAMPTGGKLTVETANVDLDENYFRKHGVREERPGSYVMLAVSDTGAGMDKETQEHIFEPFFTTKGIGKGTGLGLATVYGIVKQNNGVIWTYSEPGQGSTFKIYFPRAKGGVASEKKEKHPVTELGGSETVLIVEDDESLRKLARTVLKQKGYKILEAENGEDAVRVSETHGGSIDLMITDVIMPKMGGREVAERLQPLYPQMKVLYMSGYTDNAIVHHGVLAPGLNFLEKPFTPEGLARKVREVLSTE